MLVLNTNQSINTSCNITKLL